MNPTVPTAQPTSNAPFNNGAPLSPQQVQQAQAQLGVPTSAPTPGGVPSNWGTMSAQDKMAKLGITTPTVPAPQPGFLDNVKSDIQNRSSNIKQIADSTPGGNVGKATEGALQIVGQGFGGFSDILKEGISSLIQKGIISSPLEPAVSASEQTLQPYLQKISDNYNTYKQANPEAAKNLEAVTNIGTGALGVTGIGEGVGAIADVAPEVVNDLADTAKGVAQGAKNIIPVSSTIPTDEAITNYIRPSLTPTEEASAKAAGRGTTTGNIIQRSAITPSDTELEMGKYAKEAGVNPNTMTTDQNIQAMKNAQIESAQKIRAGLEDSQAIWNKNDLKGAMNDVEKPITVKSDPTLNRVANGFKKAALNLASTADKNLPGLLDVRQGIDSLIDKEFPSNIYSKDTPIGQYVRNFRQALNEEIASRLPDGTLPDGSTFKGELRRQSLLYDAIDNAAANGPKVGEAVNPTINRVKGALNTPTGKLIKRVAPYIGAGALGAATEKLIP